MYRLSVVLVALVLVTACSRFDLVNLPTQDFDGQVDSGLVFDPDTGLALDVYQPPEGDAPHPVVIFLHGGGWDGGRRFDYRFMGVELSRLGFTTVVPDYRKYPDVTYPAFVKDAAAAFSWVHANIAEHGGDPDKIVVMGHSAGAHSAAMLAADQRFLATHDLQPQAIRGVIGLAGPYHFTPQSKKYVKVFNGPENFPDMQAGRFIDGNEPPMVLLHGDEDMVVNRVNLRRLADALAEKGVCHRVRLYEGVGHVGILGSFTWAYDRQPIVGDIADFASLLADGRLCPPSG